MKTPRSHSAEVDAYLDKAPPFARPILTHLRALVRAAAPDVEETMKWSRPFFVYRGVILGNMSAFKAHVSFGLWGEEAAARVRREGIASSDAMGTFGRITALADLPAERKLLALVKGAAKVIDDGVRTKSIDRPKVRVAKPEIAMPSELAAALGKNPAAKKTFAAFPPSAQREYLAWIAEAKREATRASRVAQAVVWLAEGKRRNWKYEGG